MNKLHESETAFGRELDETELAQVRGSADAGAEDWSTRGPYLRIQHEATRAEDDAYKAAWRGLGDGQPLKIVEAVHDIAVAKETQQWATQNLNYISHREQEAKEADRRAEEAELEELERLEREAQEKEENEWLVEAEAMDREAAASSAPANGGDAGVPGNAEPYTGEFPSFPGELINAPPPHTPQISIEPVDGGTGRLY